MVWSRECHIFMRRRTSTANELTDQSDPSKPAQSTSGLNNIRLIYSLPNFVHLLLVKKSNISVIRTRIIERLGNCSNGWRKWLISTSSSWKYNCEIYVYHHNDSYMLPTWIRVTNLATLDYNVFLIHLLTFLKTDVNLFFLIGAAMQWDPCSSTPNYEVFARRYGCQHENMCRCAWIC